MDIAQFNDILRHHQPWQDINEWQLYFEFITTYFSNRHKNNLIIVELGVAGGHQRYFYEQILKAKYIGIDNIAKKNPTILGNTQSLTTKFKLEELLQGKAIDLLFIDAGHTYGEVKRDYETYAPMTKSIIAMHDIIMESTKSGREDVEVKKFWDELIVKTEYPVVTLVSDKILYGIGIIIKEM